jgi:hypothetical protein
MADPDNAAAADRARDLFSQVPGRSPLLDWMRQNHALITHQLTISRPRWADLARVVVELGIRDAKGEPPKAETVRRAWQRVTDELGAKPPRRRRRRLGPSARPAAGEPGATAPSSAPGAEPSSAGGAAPTEPPASSQPPADLAEGTTTPPRPRFGTARPR